MDAVAHAFSKMVSSSHIFNRTGNVFEILPRKEGDYVPSSQAVDLAEVTGLVNKREKVGAKVWDKSVA